MLAGNFISQFINETRLSAYIRAYVNVLVVIPCMLFHRSISCASNSEGLLVMYHSVIVIIAIFSTIFVCEIWDIAQHQCTHLTGVVLLYKFVYQRYKLDYCRGTCTSAKYCQNG